MSFEPLREAHATLLHANFQDERLYRWIPQEPPDLEQLRLHYRRLEARQSPDGTEAWLNWTLRLKEEQVFAGTLEATIHANDHASIAYFVFPAFWGRGVAKEACGRLCAHLVEDWRVKQLAANIDTRNAASIALVRSLGFVVAKTIRNADFFKGSSSDEYVYRLSVADH